MRKYSTCLAALLLMSTALTADDTPVTSIDISKYYNDYQLVKSTRKTRVLTAYTSRYLANPTKPIDIKAATINALEPAYKGKQNARFFKNHLASKYRTSAQRLNIDALNAHELFCLGYLTLNDNYARQGEAITLLKKASAKAPHSYTIAAVLAMARGQRALKSDWCEVWYSTEKVLGDKKLNRDLRTRARQEFMQYMKKYKKYCKE